MTLEIAPNSIPTTFATPPYHSKHLPLSSELQAAFSYLGLQRFDTCPEFDFEPCFFCATRFESFEDSPFDSNLDYAHGVFNAHATQFSSAIQKLLNANAEIERVRFLKRAGIAGGSNS